MKEIEKIQYNVSVALCTFNGERFLIEQLESIINQDYSNIAEIICVDDCSTDNTLQILTEYAKKDRRFKVYTNNSNIGFINNFEKALSLTNSDYIAISDQDDVWCPSKVSKLMEIIGDRMMAYSDNEYVDENNVSLGKKFSDYRNLGNCKSCLNFVLLNCISGHTILFKRNLLKYALPFNNDIPHDYWLAYHAAQYSEIAYKNEALVRYRQHSNNTLGAIGVAKRKSKPSNQELREFRLHNLYIFAKNLNENLKDERKILDQLAETYINTSIKYRFKKVNLFLKNQDTLLFFKKRNRFRKIIFCIKMFWKV